MTAKATVPEMHAYFAKEPCMRFVEIRDVRYSSDEIDLMPVTMADGGGVSSKGRKKSGHPMPGHR